MRISNDSTQARTAISATAVAECPFSIADEYAKEYLQHAEAGGQEALIRVPWFAGLPPHERRVRVRMTFGLHEDISERGRRHDEIRLCWSNGSRPLPDFRATLCFRIERKQTRILIDGTYAVPPGPFSQCFDRAIGRRAARASLRDFAGNVAAYLAERERDWRRSHGTGTRSLAGRSNSTI